MSDTTSLLRSWENMPLAEVHDYLASRDVMEYPVGCCIYEDNKYNENGIFRTFIWFESVQDLILYLAIIEFPSRFGDSEHDLQQACSLLEDAYTNRKDYMIEADKEESRIVIRDDMLNEINEILSESMQIEWCGYFKELACSSRSFARRVREFYWETQIDRKSCRQLITDNIYDSFSRFLVTINEYLNEQNHIWKIDEDNCINEGDEWLQEDNNISGDEDISSEYKFKQYHKYIEDREDS